MLENFSFKEETGRKIWFTSDLHWNHDPKWDVPLWKERGYASLVESNKSIIETINNHVGANDILFSLGDLTLNCAEKDFDFLIDSLKCQNIFCLWGNHPNPMAKIYKREVKAAYPHSGEFEIEVYPFRYRNIIFVGDYLEVKINYQYFVLSHYPFSIFNNQKRGWCHLTGHSHHGFSGSVPECKEGKILDVGWDGYKKPLSFSEVMAIMDTKKIVQVDRHH